MLGLGRDRRPPRRRGPARSASAAERRSTRSASGACDSCSAGTTTHVRPEAVTRLDDAGRAARRRREGVPPRRGSRSGRLRGARRGGDPPAPERPRARRGDPGARRGRAPPTLRRGRVDRPRVRVVAGAGRGRPGDAHGREDQRRLARAGGRGARRAARAARRSRDRGRRRRRRGRGALGEGGAAVGARRRDGRRRPLDRRAPRRSRVAPASRGGARRGVRGRRGRRRRARRRSPMGDHRGHAPRPDDVRRPRCRRRPAGPSSTRSPAPSSAPARGSASRRPCSPSSSRRRRAARRSADRRARRLGARPGEECPPSRGPPAARLRDRDRAAVGGLRPDRRLDGQRADRPGRTVVRRRRPVPATGRVRDRDVPGHRVDRVDAAAARRALRAVRDRAGDEPVPRAGRDPPRARPAAGHARGRLDPRRRARQAASGEDVDRGRGGPADAPAPRPVAPRRRVACGPVPGAPAGVRPEQRARDRLDARGGGDRDARGEDARAVPHQGLRGPQHRRRGRLRAGGAAGREGRAACRSSGGRRIPEIRDRRARRLARGVLDAPTLALWRGGRVCRPVDRGRDDVLARRPVPQRGPGA